MLGIKHFLSLQVDNESQLTEKDRIQHELSIGDVVVHSIDRSQHHTPATPVKNQASIHRTHSISDKFWGDFKQDVTDSSQHTQSVRLSLDDSRSGVLWKSQDDSYLNLHSLSRDNVKYLSSDQLYPDKAPTSIDMLQRSASNVFHHRRVNSAQRRKDFASSVRKTRAKNITDNRGSVQSHSSGSCNCYSEGSGCSLFSLDAADTRYGSTESRLSMQSSPNTLQTSYDSKESGFSCSLDYTDSEISSQGHHRASRCQRCVCCDGPIDGIIHQSVAENEEHGHRHRHRHRHHKRKHHDKRKKKKSSSRSCVSSLEENEVNQHTSRSNRHSSHRKHKSAHKNKVHRSNEVNCHSDNEHGSLHKSSNHDSRHACATQESSGKYTQDVKMMNCPRNVAVSDRRSSFKKSNFDKTEVNSDLKVSRNYSDPKMSNLTVSVSSNAKRQYRPISPLVKSPSEVSIKGRKTIVVFSRPPWVDGDDIEAGIREEVSSHLQHMVEEQNITSKSSGTAESSPCLKTTTSCNNMQDDDIQDSLVDVESTQGTSNNAADSAYESKPESTEQAGSRKTSGCISSPVSIVTSYYSGKCIHPTEPNRLAKHLM